MPASTRYFYHLFKKGQLYSNKITKRKSSNRPSATRNTLWHRPKHSTDHPWHKPEHNRHVEERKPIATNQQCTCNFRHHKPEHSIPHIASTANGSLCWIIHNIQLLKCHSNTPSATECKGSATGVSTTASKTATQTIITDRPKPTSHHSNSCYIDANTNSPTPASTHTAYKHIPANTRHEIYHKHIKRTLPQTLS